METPFKLSYCRFVREYTLLDVVDSWFSLILFLSMRSGVKYVSLGVVVCGEPLVFHCKHLVDCYEKCVVHCLC